MSVGEPRASIVVGGVRYEWVVHRTLAVEDKSGRLYSQYRLLVARHGYPSRMLGILFDSRDLRDPSFSLRRSWFRSATPALIASMIRDARALGWVPEHWPGTLTILDGSVRYGSMLMRIAEKIGRPMPTIEA